MENAEELGTPRLFAFMRTMSTCSGRAERLAADRKRVVSCKGGYGTEFAPLYANANASAFVGLTDFDVLSDGTICA
ncbi:MAG: hypothetical protein ACLR5S_08680 [Ruminococcus sp.]